MFAQDLIEHRQILTGDKRRTLFRCRLLELDIELWPIGLGQVAVGSRHVGNADGRQFLGQSILMGAESAL